MLTNIAPVISYFGLSNYVKLSAVIKFKRDKREVEKSVRNPFAIVLEVVMVDEANQVEFLLNYNYLTLHKNV